MPEGQYRLCSILVNTLLLPFPVDVPVSMWATPERRAAMRKRCPHTRRQPLRTFRAASDIPTTDADARHCKTPTIRRGSVRRLDGREVLCRRVQLPIDLATGHDASASERGPRSAQSRYDVLFPPVPVELLPESETRFFERLSGVPMDFSRAAKGKVTRLALHYHGNVFRYARISDTPPKAPVPGKPPVLVKLDTNHLDACAGCNEVYCFTGVARLAVDLRKLNSPTIFSPQQRHAKTNADNARSARNDSSTIDTTIWKIRACTPSPDATITAPAFLQADESEII